MFTIFPGTTIIFFGVLPSIHLAEFSWARAAFSIYSRGISAGSSMLKRALPLKEIA